MHEDAATKKETAEGIAEVVAKEKTSVEEETVMRLAILVVTVEISAWDNAADPAAAAISTVEVAAAAVEDVEDANDEDDNASAISLTFCWIRKGMEADNPISMPCSV